MSWIMLQVDSLPSGRHTTNLQVHPGIDQTAGITLVFTMLLAGKCSGAEGLSGGGHTPLPECLQAQPLWDQDL